jgi:NAD(P)-dependent dehydrogenase (short-subunit alcohol dehydrogenase family)
MELRGQTVVVTGAGTGVGRAASLALMNAGFTVVLAGRRVEMLEETKKLGDNVGKSLCVSADMTNPGSIAALFAKVMETYGRLDVLFNNAGVGAPPVPLEDLPFDIGVQRLKEVNGLTRYKRMRPGQMVLVPLELRDVPTNLDETYNHSNFQASPEEYSASVRYRVRSGDTLSSIARKHHTSVARILTVNSLKSNHLRVGQPLVIYQDSRPAKRAALRRGHIHRVSN